MTSGPTDSGVPISVFPNTVRICTPKRDLNSSTRGTTGAPLTNRSVLSRSSSRGGSSMSQFIIAGMSAVVVQPNLRTSSQKCWVLNDSRSTTWPPGKPTHASGSMPDMWNTGNAQ